MSLLPTRNYSKDSEFLKIQAIFSKKKSLDILFTKLVYSFGSMEPNILLSITWQNMNGDFQGRIPTGMMTMGT